MACYFKLFWRIKGLDHNATLADILFQKVNILAAARLGQAQL